MGSFAVSFSFPQRGLSGSSGVDEIHALKGPLSVFAEEKRLEERIAIEVSVPLNGDLSAGRGGARRSNVGHGEGLGSQAVVPADGTLSRQALPGRSGGTFDGRRSCA